MADFIHNTEVNMALRAIFCSGVFLLGIYFIPKWINSAVEKHRRKKHPMYFDFYDAGMKLCVEASDEASHDAEYLKFQFKLLTEGLVEGECTEEYFKKRFEQLADKHIETTKWFKEQQAEAEKLFREADFYAKRNNLAWGVIY